MEKYKKLIGPYRTAFLFMMLMAMSGIVLAAGLMMSRIARAEEAKKNASDNSKPRVVYPKKTELDFEGAQIEGEIRNPGEFYFQHRKEEAFDSLVKRRKNFHREMLRDAVLGK